MFILLTIIIATLILTMVNYGTKIISIIFPPGPAPFFSFCRSVLNMPGQIKGIFQHSMLFFPYPPTWFDRSAQPSRWATGPNGAVGRHRQGLSTLAIQCNDLFKSSRIVDWVLSRPKVGTLPWAAWGLGLHPSSMSSFSRRHRRIRDILTLKNEKT